MPVWLQFTQTYDVATRTTDYAEEQQAERKDQVGEHIAKWYEYLDTYSDRADTLTLNWTGRSTTRTTARICSWTALAGCPRPYYNAMRMLSMLPQTRYRATSDALSARGTGVYGLAGAKASTIAAMTWNYRWTNQASYQSTIVSPTSLPRGAPPTCWSSGTASTRTNTLGI